VRVEPAGMVTLLRSTVMMSTMLVTVELRLMAIFFRVLTGDDSLIDVNKVQAIAAAVKKNLALFLTFFWVGKRVFGLTGLPTTCYDEGLSHRILIGRLTPSTFTLNTTSNTNNTVNQPLFNCLTDKHTIHTSIG